MARIRSGSPAGFSRLGWVHDLANLNEFFVHHEDVRQANGMGPRGLSSEMDAALGRNVRRGGRLLSRPLDGCGLVVAWAGERVTVHSGSPAARLSGAPGELLPYLFGRQAAADVSVSGAPEAVAALRRTHFGISGHRLAQSQGSHESLAEETPVVPASQRQRFRPARFVALRRAQRHIPDFFVADLFHILDLHSGAAGAKWRHD